MKKWINVFAEDKLNITAITHPDYDAMFSEWEKYRTTFQGGANFIAKYLKQFSSKENATDFANRKAITYLPALSKAAVMDVKNAIYQRLVDIKRTDGPTSYLEAATGEGNGVDFKGNSMSSFIGRIILPELLSMAKVGVFVDKNPLVEGASKADAKGIRPYLYMYRAEDIRSWTINEEGTLVNVLLRDNNEKLDPVTGLVAGTTKQYRHAYISDAGTVQIDYYDANGKPIAYKNITLELTKIPFVVFEITQSLLIDVCEYQMALLNLASSDINYAWKSNYPFYTEQFDPVSEQSMLRSSNANDNTSVSANGTAAEAKIAKSPQVDLGLRQGRRYPRGLERPMFIHPSAEPLYASMKKQDQMKEEIRQLINLSIASLESTRASAASKQEDSKGLEAGLSYIGLELEYGERQISSIWAAYEGSAEATVISYPTSYSLKTDSERRTEAKELREELPNIPSITYQKEMAKLIVSINLGTKVSSDTLKKIVSEIEASEVVVTDPEIIVKDHEAGFVSTQLASELRGYPKNQVEQAKKDHAERLARIAAAQSDPSSRGLKDMSDDDDAGEDEKEKAGMKDMDGDAKDKTKNGRQQ